MVAHLVFRAAGPAICGATNPAADYAPDAPECGDCRTEHDRWSRNHVGIYRVGDPVTLSDGSAAEVVRITNKYPTQDIYVLSPGVGVVVVTNRDLAYRRLERPLSDVAFDAADAVPESAEPALCGCGQGYVGHGPCGGGRS